MSKKTIRQFIIFSLSTFQSVNTYGLNYAKKMHNPRLDQSVISISWLLFLICNCCGQKSKYSLTHKTLKLYLTLPKSFAKESALLFERKDLFTTTFSLIIIIISCCVPKFGTKCSVTFQSHLFVIFSVSTPCHKE